MKINFKPIAAASLLSLAGCSITPNHDGLHEVFIPAGLASLQAISVRWAVIGSPARVSAICQKALKSSASFVGCAIISPSGDCLIVTPSLTTWNVVGHEWGHCMLHNRKKDGLSVEGFPAHFVYTD